MQRRAWWRLAAVTLTALSMLTAASVAPGAAWADELSDRRQQLAELEKRRADERQRLEALRAWQKVVQDELTQSESAVMVAAVQLVRTRAQVDETAGQIVDVERRLSQIELDRQRHTELFQRRLRGYYIRSRVSGLEVLLGSTSFMDFLARLVSLEAIVGRDNALINQLTVDRQVLVDERKRLEAKKLQLLALQDRAEGESAQLARQMEAKKALVARIDAQEQGLDQEVDDMGKASSRLEGLIRSIMSRPTPTPRPRPTATPLPPSPTPRPPDATPTPTRVPSSSAAPSATPLLPRPTQAPDDPRADASLRAPAPFMSNRPDAVTRGAVAWPLQGIVTAEFGDRTPFQRFHTGIDIADPVGSPVVAAADGAVIFAGLFNPDDRQSYGLAVVIAHNARLSTVYAHLDDKRFGLSVHTGQQVRRGQLLGRVGTTGWTTGPHLHFETRMDGIPENPRRFL